MCSGRIDVVRKCVRIGGEPITNAVNVFAEVDPARTDVRQHLFESDHLLLRRVPPIVDENIHRRSLFAEALPELTIFLIADENCRTAVFICLATGINIHSGYPAFWTKIVVPHLETAAAEYSNFHNVNIAAGKLAEVPLIDIKIMYPLEDDAPFLVGIKVAPERVGPRACVQRTRGRFAMLYWDPSAAEFNRPNILRQL